MRFKFNIDSLWIQCRCNLTNIASLFEVHSKLVLNPRVYLGALLAGVHIALPSQVPTEQLADPRDVAGLVLRGHGVVTRVPGQETFHLALGGGILHPLDDLP